MKNIKVINDTQTTVTIKFENADLVDILPHEYKEFQIEQEMITFFLCHQYESNIPPKCDKYNLVVNSSYVINNLSNGDVFHIEQKVINVNYQVYYDILCITHNNNIIQGTYLVTNEVFIKKRYRRKNIYRVLFWDIIAESTEATLIFFVVGIVLTHFLKWKFALVYFPVSYIVLLVCNTFFGKITEKFMGGFLKKTFNIENNELPFNEYFMSDIINIHILSNQNGTQGTVL